MKNVESKIGNHRQRIHNPLQPYEDYHLAFNETIDNEDPILPYGDEFTDLIPKEIDKKYLDSLDKYIGT